MGGLSKKPKTITIDGEYNSLNKFQKFAEPLVYVRLPPEGSSQGRGCNMPRARSTVANRRAGSVPVSMGRSRYMGWSGNGDASFKSQSEFKERTASFLKGLWVPFWFLCINAVCYAIDPAAAALMMASSTFMMHQLDLAGHTLTAFTLLAGGLGLWLHGSDIIYIMVVHGLYYCAIAMHSRNAETSQKKKRGDKSSGEGYF